MLPRYDSTMNYSAVAICGPTACGKTGRAVALAEALGSEIISADSRQVYRRMDLGTGKDLEDYGDIPCHLIDIMEPGTKYNLHQYLRDFNLVFEDMCSRGLMPVICGGTGMYLENALSGLILPEVPENPELRASLAGKTLRELTIILSSMKTLHNITDVDTCQRAIRAIEIQTYYNEHPGETMLSDKRNAKPLDALVIAIDISREKRRERISERLSARLEAGMVDEVKSLLDEGIPAENLIYYGLEYKYLTEYVTGKISFDEMRHSLEIAIHQFAKRQMTWLRGMERRGFKLHWLPYDLSNGEFVSEVKRLMASADR